MKLLKVILSFIFGVDRKAISDGTAVMTLITIGVFALILILKYALN